MHVVLALTTFLALIASNASLSAQDVPSGEHRAKDDSIDRYVVVEERSPRGILLKRERFYRTTKGKIVAHGLE